MAEWLVDYAFIDLKERSRLQKVCDARAAIGHAQAKIDIEAELGAPLAPFVGAMPKDDSHDT